ncbi:MAG: hypothetical protein F6K00_07865 [Leptolyngbya sp. SIOISBB]|nr:hypothetical protein [Leptolyngbya sp. SIOISBB]
MNSFTPGIIIALLIMFLVGILVGYSLVQKRLSKQAEELKVSQRRLAEIEQSHELRLREATDRLRHDYESQLATTIEHYQDQLSQKTIEMEQTYETRFRVLQQGAAPATTQPAPLRNADIAAAIPTPDASIEVDPQPSSELGMTSTPPAMPQRELMHLKRQYEMRLHEATQKLQQSYETQLAEHTKAAQAELQKSYDQQLATQYQEFEQEFAERQAELERELAELRAEPTVESSTLASEVDIPTPSEIMGTGDETTVALTSPGAPAEVMPIPTAGQYTQSEVDQQLEAAMQQAEAEFDQRLTEQLAAQQVQFDRRLRELEADYQQRLTTPIPENVGPSITPSPAADLFGDDGYEDLVADLNPEMAGTTPSEPEPDLFSNDDSLTANPPLPSAESEPEETTAETAEDLLADSSLSEETAFIDDSLHDGDSMADEAIDVADNLAAAFASSPQEDDAAIETTAESENLFGEEGDDLDDLFGESTAEDSIDPLADLDVGMQDNTLTAEETSFSEVDDLFVETDTTPVPQLDEMNDLQASEPDPGENLFDDDDLATALEATPDERTTREETESDIGDDLFGDDDLAAALEATPAGSDTSAEASLNIEDDLFGDNDLFAETPPTQPVSEDALTEAEADLFGDNDFFADFPPAESSDNSKDDGDDDFGPLDLSDIS